MNWLLKAWWKIRGVSPEDYYRKCGRCGKKGRDHAGLTCLRFRPHKMYDNEVSP